MPDLSPSLFEGIHKLPLAVKGVIWKESNVPLASLKSDDKFVPSGKQMVSDVREAFTKEKITKTEHDNAALEIVKASAGSPHEVDALSEYLKSAHKDPSLLKFDEIQNHTLFTKERVADWTPEFTESAAGILGHIPTDKKQQLEELIQQSPQITKPFEAKYGTKTLDLESKEHQNTLIEIMPDLQPKTQKVLADAIEKTTTHKMAVAALNERPNRQLANGAPIKANDWDLMQEFQKPEPDYNQVFTLLRTERTQDNPQLNTFFFQSAFQHGNTDAVQYLGKLEKKDGIDLNFTHPADPSQNTLFLHALDNKQLIMAQTLAEAGADVKATNAHHLSAMHIAAEHNHADALPVLKDLGLKADVVNDTGFTPLHVAANKGAEQSTRKLHELGTNINIQDAEGLTPLDWALEGAKQNRKELQQLGDINKHDFEKLKQKEALEQALASSDKTIATLRELGGKYNSELT